jgi:3' terminal RNA ribose 2'-O-methyltransferase Hen1
MLLTLTLTRPPATDLGYLLGKNPSRVQSFDLSFGRVHIFYPESSPERCTAALLLDIDPVGLVRNRRGPAGDGGLLAQYVNDRPYVASSFLSVALSRVFGSALAGRSRDRQELAETSLPLCARLAVVPCSGGERLLRRLFEPLGYSLSVERAPLDEQFPAWGESPYFTLELSATCRLSELLSHLYVLVPVLDDEKHYWVGDDEVEKLLRHGAGWLAGHPERDIITRRYLKYQGGLARAALGRLAEDDPPTVQEEDGDEPVATKEERIRLNDLRLESVCRVLRDSRARRVLDLGCADGKLLVALARDSQFAEVVGVDVSHRALEIARRRVERLPGSLGERVRILHGSLIYRDERLAGFDAAAVVEVIEHLDPHRLNAFARVLFEFTRPRVVALTTPNAEYNVKFAGLAAGTFRHRDHRFEWSRLQFREWAERAASRFGYELRIEGIGPEDPLAGTPTQMAVFTRAE